CRLARTKAETTSDQPGACSGTLTEFSSFVENKVHGDWVAVEGGWTLSAETPSQRHGDTDASQEACATGPAAGPLTHSLTFPLSPLRLRQAGSAVTLWFWLRCIATPRHFGFSVFSSLGGFFI